MNRSSRYSAVAASAAAASSTSPSSLVPIRGTTLELPPVHSLNRYQAGFASRSLVSSPAEPQKMQWPPSSDQVNHQTPPTPQRTRLDESIANDFESWNAWPKRPRCQLLGPSAEPQPSSVTKSGVL